MRLLFLTILLSTSALAGPDCLQEYYNYYVGLKFKGSFTDLYETQKDILKTSPELKVICKDKAKNEMWESERKGMKEGFALKKDEMSKSYKISTGELDLLKSNDSVYIGNEDICARMDKAVKENENCYETAEFAKKLRKYDILNSTFEESCLKLGPDIVRKIQVCKYKN